MKAAAKKTTSNVERRASNGKKRAQIIQIGSLIPRNQYTRAWCEAEILIFRKRPPLTVSQWAARYRIVETGPRKGRWRNETTPYLQGPMDAWNNPHIRKIICRFAPQTGKTQIAFNALCYAADYDPGPAMYVMPDEKVARRISHRRLRPLFEKTPRTAALLSEDPRDNTALSIYFRNGMSVLMAWATSAAELASESIRYLILDEVDKFPEFSGKEADPIALAEIRTNAYPHTSKVLMLSTPTVEEGYISRAIEEEADEKRLYEVPCPKCGAFQVMRFEDILFSEKSTDPRVVVRKRLARYRCPHCGHLWDDHARDRAVRKGRWRAEKPVDNPVTVAFHLPSWYSPFVSLSSVAAAFLRGNQEGPHKLYIFRTQHEALPWKEDVDKKEESEILANRTDIPPGVVPPDTIALTAGIDMQKNGFWFTVWAFKEDLSPHLVQYGWINTWEDLGNLIFETRYPVMGGGARMGIYRAALDTGGGESPEDDWTRTEEAYTWLRANSRGIIYGIKGASRPQLRRVEVKIIDKMKRGNRLIPGGLELRFLDTAQFKEIIHWRFARGEGQSQRITLHADTGMDFARQILAERKKRDYRTGRIKWKQIRRDNHLLDATVYAFACADPQWTPSIQYIHKARKIQKVRGKRRVISKGIRQ